MDTVSALCIGCFSFDVACSLRYSVSARCVAAKSAQESYCSFLLVQMEQKLGSLCDDFEQFVKDMKI